MLNLSPFNNRLCFDKLLRQLRLIKFLMMLNRVPTSQENELFILTLLVDSPTSKAGVGRSKRFQVGQTCREETIEFLLVTFLNEASSDSNDWC